MEDVRAQLSRLLSLESLHKLHKPSSVKLSDLSQKDASISIEARKKGNDLYTQRDNHNREIHRNILLQYSKSIAFAPIDSDELALAYSNRSVLLLHVQRYKECLIDIEKSMQITKTDVLKAKLESRKEKCLSLMKNQVTKGKARSKQSKSDKTLGIYKMTPSSQMPVATEAISASYNDTFGRHLVATRDIKAGEVVLLERAFACLPRISQIYLVCNHCLKFAWNGIPCNNCAIGIYCSEECKKEAWEEYHEVECSLLPFMSSVMYKEEGLTNSLIIAARMLVKAIKNEGLDAILKEAKTNRKGLEGMIDNGMIQNDKFATFYNLLSHEKVIRKLYQRMRVNESEVIQLFSKHTQIFDAVKRSSDDTIEHDVILQLERILGKLVDIIKVNAFGYHGYGCECLKFGKAECECDSTKGMFLATCASFVNHSCIPNVSRMNLPKGKIAFFTFTPIKKGEQVCIELCDSYGPTIGMPRDTRKEVLEKNFFFTCKCIACEEDWFGQGPVDLNKFHVEENIKMNIMTRFERSFPHAMESSLFADEMNDWKFDEEQLKMAVKITDLIYKYHKSPLAALTHSLQFRMYIDMAFNELYGENAALPENCSSV